jgi:hypothetical protein
VDCGWIYSRANIRNQGRGFRAHQQVITDRASIYIYIYRHRNNIYTALFVIVIWFNSVSELDVRFRRFLRLLWVLVISASLSALLTLYLPIPSSSSYFILHIN